MVRSLKIGLFFDWFGKSDGAAACNIESIDVDVVSILGRDLQIHIHEMKT